MKILLIPLELDYMSNYYYSREKKYFARGGARWYGPDEKNSSFDYSNTFVGFLHQDNIELFTISKAYPYDTANERTYWDLKTNDRKRKIIYLSKKIKEIPISLYKEKCNFSKVWKIIEMGFYKFDESLL